MTASDIAPYFAGLAGFLFVAGFALRDLTWLRILATIGTIVLLGYFLLLSSPPHWPALLLAAALAAVNIWHLSRGVIRNGKFQLSGEEMMLFARLPGLTPGQFKSLLEIAEWHTPTVPLQLTQTAQMPKALYYVLEGQVEVNRDKQRFTIGPHAFIGELAFLRAKPATAATFAKAGSLIVSWDHTDMRELMRKDDGIRRALDTLLTADLAEKIARSTPPALQEQQA